MIPDELRRAARAWLDDDPDPRTRRQLQQLLDDDDRAALDAAFAEPLGFGTAGIRGSLGPGPGHLNVSVVRRCAAGLVRWLDDLGATGPVVIGRDARHGSDRFAHEIAAVVAGAGRPVLVFPAPVPTPLLAYAVLDLSAAAGVMVTASHNPPEDNGVKVYAGDGAQIVPPADEAIAAGMAAVASVRELPLAADDAPLLGVVDPAVRDRYLAGVAATRLVSLDTSPAVAYTPLHGVGRPLLLDAFERAGLARPHVVAAQADPDPDFPTVAFPNPEEPGVMDRVLALATEHGADLALANDPDADRLAAAVPDDDGGWRVLSGDELGVLLADHLLCHSDGDDRLVATTIVSSSMLAGLAAAHGVHHVETLTGFKWLARAALDRPDLRPVLAYEEALGYQVGDLVRDKDGIGAAVTTVEAVGALAAVGVTVPQRLAELAVAHGLHRTRQRSTRFERADGGAAMAAAVERVRSSPPAALGGIPIEQVDDLRRGEELPPTDAVVLRGAGLRVVVRPSGTEPKLKLYVQVVRAVGAVVEVAGARASADATIEAVLDDLDHVLLAGDPT